MKLRKIERENGNLFKINSDIQSLEEIKRRIDRWLIELKNKEEIDT